MDPTLARQLSPRVDTKNWDSLFKVSLTGDEEVPINKRGSGVRRLILINFFRAKAEQAASEKGGPDIVYGIEEPETSQHPHNQRMLLEAFSELSQRSNCQVILTTHTPVLSRFLDDRTLKYVRINEDNSREILESNDDTKKQIARDLGIIADHNIRVFVGVEGKHDINFLKNISKILHNAGEDVPDLEEEESEGRLMFVPVGGSNLALWTTRLDGLNRPEYHLMDRDTQPPAKARYHSLVEEINQRDNAEAWITKKKELENYLHPNAIRIVYPGYTGKGGDFEDVPLLAAHAAHDASSDQNKGSWADIENDGKKLEAKKSRAKQRLNTEAVEAMTPSLLTEIDRDNEVRGWLSKIGIVLQRE